MAPRLEHNKMRARLHRQPTRRRCSNAHLPHDILNVARISKGFGITAVGADICASSTRLEEERVSIVPKLHPFRS